MTNPDLYAEALAEIRALRPKPAATAPKRCCTGDRRGYQWHQRTGHLPACEAALEANRAYIAGYRTGLRKAVAA